MKRHKTNMEAVGSGLDDFGTSGGEKFLKLAEGTNIIRVLPPWSDAGMFFFKIAYHSAGFQKARVLCMQATYGKRCKICEKRVQVQKKLGREAAEAFEPDNRALINCIDMKSKDKKVKVLECARTIINPILRTLSEEEDDELIDPNAGHNLTIRKLKKGNKTTYEVQFRTKQYDLAEHGMDVEEVLSSMHDLSKVPYIPKTEDVYEVLQELMEKIDAAGDDGDEDELDDDQDGVVNDDDLEDIDGEGDDNDGSLDDEEEEEPAPPPPKPKAAKSGAMGKKAKPAKPAKPAKKAPDPDLDDDLDDEGEDDVAADGPRADALPELDDIPF